MRNKIVEFNGHLLNKCWRKNTFKRMCIKMCIISVLCCFCLGYLNKNVFKLYKSLKKKNFNEENTQKWIMLRHSTSFWHKFVITCRHYGFLFIFIFLIGWWWLWPDAKNGPNLWVGQSVGIPLQRSSCLFLISYTYKWKHLGFLPAIYITNLLRYSTFPKWAEWAPFSRDPPQDKR